MARELGDKLGPRLSRLVIGHTLALRRHLAPVESRIHAAATQQLIDRAGREVADMYRPILDPILKGEHGDIHPLAQGLLEKTASGEHQWQALAGVLGGLGQSALSGVFSNLIAPVSYRINEAAPNLLAPPAVQAALWAAGIKDTNSAETAGQWQGFHAEELAAMEQLAEQIPDPQTLGELVNRGLLSEQAMQAWLHRGAVPAQLRQILAALRFQILSPADAALAVLRGNLTLGEGEHLAALNGVSVTDFRTLIANTGEPLALEEMLQLHRRGKMTDAVLTRGILQSRVRDEWIPYALELSVVPPTTADVLEALVQGEVSQPEAVRRYQEAGGDPSFFETAFRTRANSPAPVQLSEMANRGIIPWDGTGPAATTFRQGFMEGRWKDKWEPAFRALAVYLPPPREVTTLAREGAVTEAQAEKYWKDHGLSPELAHQYWVSAHFQRTSRVHELAASEIERLYQDQAITRAEAAAMLTSINWSKIDANWLLDITDLKRERAFLERAISQTASKYIAHKINATQAKAALAALEVSASQADNLIKTWTLERADNLKTLTVAEIADAFHYSLMTPQEAMARLEQEGYQPLDAWYVLAIKNKAAPPGLPKPA